MRRLLLCLALCLASCLVNAQSINDFRQNKQGRFDAYKKQKQDSFMAYRNKKNAEMEAFIRAAWEKMPGNRPVPVPPREDKDVPPVVMPEEDRDKVPENTPVPIQEVIPPVTPTPKPEPLAPIKEVPVQSPQVTLSFYGTQCSVRFDKASAPRLSSGKESSVADMWKALCSEQYINFYLDCMQTRDRHRLCDWAYVQFSDALSRQIYGDSDDARVLQASVLLQSGYRILMGRDAAGHIHVLMATDSYVFARPYWTVEGEQYYLFDGTTPESLNVMTKNLVHLQKIRLFLTGENAFADAPTPSRSLSSQDYPEVGASVYTNKNLIGFYDSYPESFANNDPYTKWRFYAMAPLSADARKGLYPPLKKAIAGKSELESANILLNFVQTAFVYEYDDKVWGRDRSFFADETLFYPFCDCEDRSILFSRLVRDLMGLDVVLVYHPGHLYTAVRFRDDVAGDYLTIDGNKYVVCDPTYIHAPVGKTMPGMDNTKAVAVKL